MGAEKEQNRQAGSRGVEENQEDLVMGWLGRDAAEGDVEAGTCSDLCKWRQGLYFPGEGEHWSGTSLLGRAGGGDEDRTFGGVKETHR